MSNPSNISETSETLDVAPCDLLVSGHKSLEMPKERDKAQSDKARVKEGLVIEPDAWQEWLAVAHYLYRLDPEAEIVDVFEWLRKNDLGQNIRKKR